MKAWLLAACLACAASPARALLFEEYVDGSKRRILFIRDCGRGGISKDTQCTKPQSGFEQGDSQELERRLVLSERAAAPFEEVWLYSGGGNLQQGVEIGRLLRRYKMTVRIPNFVRVRSVLDWPGRPQVVQCVSSCTVAFMGGLFRYMDDDTTYEVHSASGVRDVAPKMLEAIRKEGFSEFAAKRQRYARFTARQLMTHFQNTLTQPLGIAPRSENDSEFARWADSGQPRYPESQAKADHQRFLSEGDGAAQDILMRIERDAMRWAIADLRGNPNLGRRAEHALRMVEVMYDVSIQDTEQLTRETMYKMGYLTRELSSDAR